MKHALPRVLAGALVVSACSGQRATPAIDAGAGVDTGMQPIIPPGRDGSTPPPDNDAAGQDGSVDATAFDAGPTCPPPASSGGAFVRYNQVGYRTADAKHLYLISPAALPGSATFQVQDGNCTAKLTSPIGADRGSWNTAFPHVYLLDASSLTGAGNYTLTASSGAISASATFTVGPGPALYGGLLSQALHYYKAQRDGPNVDPTVLAREPSHLADQMATVYAIPSYATDGSDVLQAALTPSGGAAVDVSGGWFDAGDFLKFVETTSYVEAIMLLAVRDHPSDLGPSGLADFYNEASFGIAWLLRMWNDSTQTLLYQVGIGDGSSTLNINGDHDLWRLPEKDDTLQVQPGDPQYYLRYRPAFQAAPAGSQVSPNLAGRLAADFALCSQVMRATNSVLANQCLLAGEHVFALANTSPSQLLTASPYDYYPETAWQDDLELGATELYLALVGAGTPPAGLPQTDAATYLGQAATWAKAYVSSPFDGTDSLNLYDVSALSHHELFNALAKAGAPTNLAITQAGLVSDLMAQVKTASALADADPFALGTPYGAGGSDAIPHALGLALSADFYQELSGDSQFEAFGEAQRDYVFGANAWGTSFVVGAGRLFPQCLQHEVANLSGALDGTSPILVGAVVDGPTDPASLTGLTSLSGMRVCPPAGGDGFSAWNGHGASYQDNVLAWPTVEPADDYVALTILLYARQ
jgi:endoglucanase